MIEMMDDLRANGRDSRYLKHLGDVLYELKTRTVYGGARVYFFRLGREGYVLVRAEVKQENEATEALLLDTLDVAEAVEKGKARLVPKPREEDTDEDKGQAGKRDKGKRGLVTRWR